MKEFFLEICCMFGVHEWHEENRRGHLKRECERCGHTRWELNSD